MTKARDILVSHISKKEYVGFTVRVTVIIWGARTVAVVGFLLKTANIVRLIILTVGQKTKVYWDLTVFNAMDISLTAYIK